MSSRKNYYENSMYPSFKPQGPVNWASNIESIIRLTQRNLSGISPLD